MKTAALLLVVAGSCLRLFGQQAPQNGQERFFLPKDTFWGYAQFEIAPPHNEIDPNLCAANAGNYGGKSAPCNAFARYMLSGILEARPFGRGPLRRFMLWGEPHFLFGKNVPQNLYTWSFDAIGVEHSWRGHLRGSRLRDAGHPALPVRPFWSTGPLSGNCRPWPQWSLGALQHDWRSQVLWNAKVVGTRTLL